MVRDHFAIMGLGRAYHLDAADLDARYLKLQRETHPDRFVKALPHERLEAVIRNTELNDAYKVLKNDRKRAEYLLKLEGMDVGDEEGRGAGKPKVDPELLVEIMDLREQLVEARADSDEARVRGLVADVMNRQDQARATIEAGFRAYERGDRGQLESIANALIALRYYARFMDEVDGKDH